MIMETTIIVMSVFLLIALMISLILLIADGDIFTSNGLPSLKCEVGLVAFLSTIVILTLAIALKRQPKAIDVYKGKTTLVISYKDEVPIDTVVVWK